MISRRTSSVRKEDVFPRLPYSDSTCSQTFGRCSQACGRRSQACGRRSQACRLCSQMLLGWWWALWDLLPAHPGALRCTWRLLNWSSKLWNMTTLVFWSDNSQTLPEAPSDQTTVCWWDCVLHHHHTIPPRYRRSYPRLEVRGCHPKKNSCGHQSLVSGHQLCCRLVGQDKQYKKGLGCIISLPPWPIRQEYFNQSFGQHYWHTVQFLH